MYFSITLSDFSLVQSVQTDSRAHPVSNSTRDSALSCHHHPTTNYIPTYYRKRTGICHHDVLKTYDKNYNTCCMVWYVTWLHAYSTKYTYIQQDLGTILPFRMQHAVLATHHFLPPSKSRIIDADEIYHWCSKNCPKSIISVNNE